MTIFYILLCYVMLQFCWWAWLLVDLNAEVVTYKTENLLLQQITPQEFTQQRALLQKKLHAKWWMIAGEGVVFLSLLGFGAHRALKTFKQEVNLNKQQQNFLLSVTHELKSPLASIKLQLQTLQRRSLDPDKQKSIIGNAVADADRLNILIEKTLLATRMEGSTYRLQKANVDVVALLERILDERAAKLEVVRHFTGPVLLQADEMALTSVFLNLIENAEKYAPEGGMLRIGAKVEKNQAVISFADEGTAIPDAEKKKVFDKFYRVGNEHTRTTKGTGLGLFIVRQVVRQHGGQVVVKDNQPKGNVFEVHLPLA